MLDNSVTPETVFPGAQLTPAGSFQTWMSLRPSFFLRDDFAVRARADMTMEWVPHSAEASTTLLYQPLWSDPNLDAVYYGLPKVWGIQSTLGAGISLPLSLASQYRGTYFTGRLLVGANRVFEHLGPGSLSVGLSVIGLRAFAQYNTPSMRSGYDCVSQGWLPTLCTQGVGTNPAFSLWLLPTVGYTWKQFSLNASYALINNWASDLPEAQVPPSSGNTAASGDQIPRNPQDQRLRQAGWFYVSVDYEALEWLSFSLGYYTFRDVLDPGGGYGNPFWSPGGGSRVFLTATFALDYLANSLTGRNQVRPGTTTPSGSNRTTASRDGAGTPSVLRHAL